MNDYKVSIIIPCYNSALYIKDSIESALNQTYKNIEVIVINDGSTDDSEKIIQRDFADKITYIKQTNAGVSSARNNGIRISTGDWILTLDSDDYINPYYVEDAIKLIEDKKTLITSRAFFTDKDLNLINKIYPEGNIFKENINLESMVKHNLVVTTSLFSKFIWKISGGYNEYLHRAEDWEFWTNLISCGAQVKWVKEREPYFKYRTHGESKSSRNEKFLIKTQRYIKQKYKI
jgi:glycosyltransferase involved in cell wall biosynthesis